MSGMAGHFIGARLKEVTLAEALVKIIKARKLPHDTILDTDSESLHDQNKAFAHDDFWKFLRKIIVTNKIYTFTPSIIKQLQDASWKHSKSIRESK